MNTLSVNSYILANTSGDHAYLAPALGAYEICFSFSLSGSKPEKISRAHIYSADIRIKFKKSERRIGLATLEQPLLIKGSPSRNIIEQLTFRLPITPNQLTHIEELRDGHDLEFMLQLNGHGRRDGHTNKLNEQWRIRMPRSEWIQQLKQAGYMDILLLEVPMPPKNTSNDWGTIKENFEEAQRHFMNSEYRSCISSCRDIIQEAGQKKFGHKSWAEPILDKLGTPHQRSSNENSRKNMSKDERATAIWASLRHYTHMAHHTPEEGGERTYNRSEAKLILTLTAALLSS